MVPCFNVTGKSWRAYVSLSANMFYLFIVEILLLLYFATYVHMHLFGPLITFPK